MNKNLVTTPLSIAILYAILAKVEYFVNSYFPDTYRLESDKLFWQKQDLTQPLLTIHYPNLPIQLWYNKDSNEVFCSLEITAEEDLDSYIDIEQFVLTEIEELEKKFHKNLKMPEIIDPDAGC